MDQGNPTISQSMIFLANDNAYMDNLPNGYISKLVRTKQLEQNKLKSIV